MKTWLISLFVLVVFNQTAFGQSRGIVGQNAPNWGVTEWINLPDGESALDICEYEGKVLYLYGFQSWCPGCHSRGFPTLTNLIEHYEDADDVAFVAVQTTFEGFSTNDFDAAKRTAERYKLKIPVGHDGSNGKRSILMQRYRTGGTPWTIIIDKNGVVRYDDFHIHSDHATKLIDTLRKESATSETKHVETLPESRGGQDMVGKKFANLTFDRWLNNPNGKSAPDSGKVTLYRWWTDSCPYCEASLPAIEQLRKKYELHGLQVICVYHPKPPRSVTNEFVLKTAKELKYKGIIAIDENWSHLKKAYPSLDDRDATSVSFLVDEKGTIRFIHPGPIFFPSNDPEHAQLNADYELLDSAIKVLLKSR